MILGRIVAFALSIVLIITFLAAWIAPGQEITIQINRYGEAELELMFLTLGLPLLIWNLIQDLKICAAARSSRPACSLFRSHTTLLEGKHGKRRGDLM
jgi:hypothetical protein